MQYQDYGSFMVSECTDIYCTFRNINFLIVLVDVTLVEIIMTRLLLGDEHATTHCEIHAIIINELITCVRVFLDMLMYVCVCMSIGMCGYICVYIYVFISHP